MEESVPRYIALLGYRDSVGSNLSQAQFLLIASLIQADENLSQMNKDHALVFVWTLYTTQQSFSSSISLSELSFLNSLSSIGVDDTIVNALALAAIKRIRQHEAEDADSEDSEEATFEDQEKREEAPEPPRLPASLSPDGQEKRVSTWLGATANSKTDHHKRKTIDSPESESSPSTKRARPALQASTRKDLNKPDCPACGKLYSSRSALRKHGQGVRTSEACRTAVAYHFE